MMVALSRKYHLFFFLKCEKYFKYMQEVVPKRHFSKYAMDTLSSFTPYNDGTLCL